VAEAALEHVRAGGAIVVVALYDDPITFNPTALVQREIRIQGSIAYTSEDFGDAVELVSTGTAQTGPLVTHHEPLDKIGEAFTVQLRKDESIKVLVEP
jgi:threonine dehydrogenase-like Zn-dependent dehydrogenase